MSSLKLTDNQRKAVETHDRNVAISAGAGSGKTRVLAERFCSIVKDGKADVDQILTVTFTEKAAKEMKDRIVCRLGELYADTGDPRLLSQSRRVESAYISTVHSFAGRVLRENAFEAGVDPRFITLEDAESQLLRNEILDQLISENSVLGNEHYAWMLDAFEETVSTEADDQASGAGDLKQAIFAIYRHACNLGIHVSEVQVADDIREIPDLVRDYVDAARGLIETAEGLDASSSLQEKVAEFRPILDRMPDEILAENRRFLDLEPEAYASSFNWDWYTSVVDRCGFKFGNSGGRGLSEHRRALTDAAKLLPLAVLSLLGHYYTDCLMRIACDFVGRYEAAKKKLGALDMHDLLIAARRLLVQSDGSASRAADQYRARFEFVFMDEFQDTNQLQKSIVEAVCRESNFFTVGDVKQSIYGFINSDVSVFIDHHRKVNADPYSLALPLADNFRSHGRVIEFVNWFFGRMWTGDSEFEYEPLEAKGEFHDNDGPGVELMLIPGVPDVVGGRLQEARAIAHRISELLGSRGKAPFMVTRIGKEDASARPLELRDIMILFRSTKAIPIYERALRDDGIDYYIVSGSGFYRSREVQDMLSLLRIIENPLDDVAMASVLRSPLVSLSMDGIYWLSQDAGPHSEAEGRQELTGLGKLYRHLASLDEISELSESDRAKLEVFRALLSELHSIRSESDLSVLLDVALTRTRYDLKMLTLRDGKRRYYNLQKFVEFVRSFQENRFFTLGDLIHHIEDLSSVDSRETEAPTETEDSQVVRLMTIHQAKGLESPVVFLADCSRGFHPPDSDPVIATRTGGITCKVKNPVTGKWDKTLEYDRQKDMLKSAGVEEEKRLLYVASTRAEELLVLSDYKGVPSGKQYHTLNYGSQNTWAGWIETAVGITQPPSAGETPVDIEAARVTVRTIADLPRSADSGSRGTLGNMGQLPEGRMDEVAASILARCQSTSVGREIPIRLTVSQVLDYASCPAMYRYRWVLGIEESSQSAAGSGSGTSSAEIGSAVHRILGMVELTGDVEECLLHLAHHEDEAIREAVLKACRTFLESEWYTRVRSCAQVLREVPFALRLDGLDLVGRIDLLFRDDAGWVVVDYKTGSGIHEARYDQQVGLYALAVYKSIGIAPVEVALASLGGGEDYTRKVVPDLIARAESYLCDDIVARIRRQEFEPIESEECRVCPFRDEYCLLTR